jgi:ATP-dependent RNA helicase DeaD
LFINLGKSSGFYAEQLIELVNSNTRGRKIRIGKIELLKGFSFFEVEKGCANDLIDALNTAEFAEKRVAVEVARDKYARSGKGQYPGDSANNWQGIRDRQRKFRSGRKKMYME